MQDEFEYYILFRFIKVIYIFLLIISLIVLLGVFIAGIINQGDLKNSFLLLIIGSIIIYSLLNIIRETLIYIFFGRKFTWLWFIKLVKYLNSP